MQAGANRGENASLRVADRSNGGYAAGLGTQIEDLEEEFELALRARWSHEKAHKSSPDGSRLGHANFLTDFYSLILILDA